MGVKKSQIARAQLHNLVVSQEKRAKDILPPFRSA